MTTATRHPSAPGSPTGPTGPRMIRVPVDGGELTCGKRCAKATVLTLLRNAAGGFIQVPAAPAAAMAPAAMPATMPASMPATRCSASSRPYGLT